MLIPDWDDDVEGGVIFQTFFLDHTEGNRRRTLIDEQSEGWRRDRIDAVDNVPGIEDKVNRFGTLDGTGQERAVFANLLRA